MTLRGNDTFLVVIFINEVLRNVRSILWLYYCGYVLGICRRYEGRFGRTFLIYGCFLYFKIGFARLVPVAYRFNDGKASFQVKINCGVTFNCGSKVVSVKYYFYGSASIRKVIGYRFVFFWIVGSMFGRASQDFLSLFVLRITRCLFPVTRCYLGGRPFMPVGLLTFFSFLKSMELVEVFRFIE